LEWPARCDKIVPNQILLCPTLLKFSLALRVEPACLQLALASLCSDTARSMPGCDPREAARQVFVRLRSEAPSGPYAEARKAFETHLASCVERVRQRASTELSSLRALEVAARGAISNGNGGTGSSRTSSCSAAADAPEHPPPPSSKSGCADGKCDTGQDDDSGGSAWARAAGCFVPSFVAGMLGSSCCLIQILLNSLAVGCAGFNKVLGGRVRGPLRLLSCVWLAVLWQRALVRRRGRRDAALSTLLCLGLTLLPEALLYSGSGRAMAPGLDGSERPVLLRVEGMGCEACESHVRAVIERSSGVVSSRVDFTVGEARLLVSDRWGFDADGLRSRLREDGYDASVVASQGAAAASGGEAPDEDAHHDERQRKEEL
jgi:copper chaperone CopZ